jgi:dihydroflavonol-4-reductase
VENLRNIDKTKPVMVTGAEGYIAGWLVKKLLDEGITVHATVWNIDDKEKLKHLIDLGKTSKGNIKLYKADLLEEHSFDEAIQNCELVFHTASPVKLKVDNPLKDLLEPALHGVTNVLNSANKSKTLKRVVLTSSIAAMYGDAIDIQEYPNKTVKPTHWNTTSTLEHQPYSFSKVSSEKKAWEICEKQKTWDLVVINPTMVVGPGISPKITSASFYVIREFGNGAMKYGIPALYMPAVDVRDLATAHFNAGFIPAAKGRYILSGDTNKFINLGNILKEKFGNKYPFPPREIPKFIAWLLAPLSGTARVLVAKNVGYNFKVDNTKSIKELGITYRPIKESMIDFFQQMVDNNVFKNIKTNANKR